MAAVLAAGVANAAGKEYWVPLISPDGTVYEIQILASDAADAKIIMCIPVTQNTFRCLSRRDKDGAYAFVNIKLEQDT